MECRTGLNLCHFVNRIDLQQLPRFRGWGALLIGLEGVRPTTGPGLWLSTGGQLQQRPILALQLP